MFIIVKLFSFFRSHAYVQIGQISKAIERGPAQSFDVDVILKIF